MFVRGGGEGEVDGKRLRTQEGLVAEGDLAEDDGEPEGSVIRWRRIP